MAEEAKQDDSFFTDVGDIFKHRFNDFLGVLVENEREPVPTTTAPTNSPAETVVVRPAVQPTGEPVSAATPFYKKSEFISWVILGLFVLLILLLITGVI